MPELLLLAVGAAFYPLYLAVVIIAFATDDPVRVLAGYVIGGAISLVTVGLIVVFLFSDASFTANQRSAVSPALNIAVGGILIAAAAFLRRWKPPHSETPGRTQRMIGSGRFSVAVAAGLLMNLVPGPLYVVGLKDIVVGDYSRTEQIVLVLVFNLIQLGTIEIPLVYGWFRPERTAELATRFNAWLRRNIPAILAGASAICGLYLVGRGVYLLAS